MTWLFVLLVLCGIGAMAWSFLAADRLESAVTELEKRLSSLDNKPEDTK